MHTHIISNNVVVNTIVIEDITTAQHLYPECICIEATSGGVGWIWDGITLTEPPITQPTVEEIVAAMESLFDTTAQSRRYDNRVTCALRAGYAGPFQAEGIAFATWMDRQNSIAYQMLAQVQAGEMLMPATIEDALALLEPMVWP